MDQLIADIYEAAVLPEHWQKALSSLTVEGDGAFASIFVQSQGDLKWVGTPEADKLIGEFAALNQPDFNSRFMRFGSKRHFGFLTDLDCYTHEEIAADSFYQTFLYPRGYGWVASRHLIPPSGELIVTSIERRFDRGPFESQTIRKLDRLAPHIARASLLAARLGLARVKAMTESLQTLGLPSAVLRRSGRLIAANKLFEAIMPEVAQERTNRLHLTNQSADSLFGTALTNGGAKSGSIPIPASFEQPAMIFHILPICGNANDLFFNASSLVIVTPIDRASVPSADVLEGLFDLTPAEARVARGIGETKTIEDLASALGVSRETIRSQLKAVLAKTGVVRQQELVALLAGKVVPLGSPQ